MKFASLDVDSRYFLSPMAGYTDKPFRFIAKKFGAGLTVSELISVNAIYYNNKKTYKLLEKNNIETPFSIQLFGADPDIFLYAAQKVEEFCDIIDINAGCPAPKVVKTFAGSYLLKEKERLFKIIDKLKKHIKKPISVKLRKGFDKNSINSMDFYKELENRGINFIVLHPRLREQYFKGEVDYTHAGKVVDLLKIPVVINGAIDSYKKVLQVQNITGCNFFMIGQTALNKPYIFDNLIKGEDKTKGLNFTKGLMKQHFMLMVDFYKEKQAVSNFRKFFHHYTKGLRYSKVFNDRINKAQTQAEVLNTISDIDA